MISGLSHLTDEQLTALLDDALPASERATCDAHLAGCEACRVRLADASALDASLENALARDPGEGYFADFADRVARRIAAGETPASPRARRTLWAWLTSPRGLTLAGSTAALLATAGIAWMRFHSEQNVARALRVASPSPTSTGLGEPPPSGGNDELRSQAASPPAASAPAETPAAERSRADATPDTRDLARAQKLRTLPNGEQVPVEPQAGAPARQEVPGNALIAPATGSAIAQMKRKSVAPATDAAAPSAGAMSTLAEDTARGQGFSEWGATKSLAKDDVAGSHVRVGRPDAARLNVSGLVAHCGKVRDSRGHELAGAQVTAVHAGVRTARTGPDGSFCIDGLKSGDTLTVMHVGFDPYTVVMTPMTSLAITLEPVGTLGPNATMLTGKAQEPAPTLGGAARGFLGAPVDSAPRPDVYAGQSSGVRLLVRDAREATAVARREHTAPSFETAAKQWAAVLGQVKGAPADDARFQYVSALRAAYQLQPTSEREARLRSAITAFLALAAASLPERATVQRWESELNGSPGR
jgi:carboxypeptidase family protein/putative zinc finger protein